MFNIKNTFLTLYLVAASGVAFAAVPDQNVQPMVISSVREHSTTVYGDKIEYNITFDVAISNLSKKPLDLSKGCFEAVMPDSSTRPLSMIDEELTEGLLKVGDNRKSFVEFSADDDSIYKAVAVKYKTVCQ